MRRLKIERSDLERARPGPGGAASPRRPVRRLGAGTIAALVIAAVAVYSGAVLFAGLTLGVAAERQDLPKRIFSRLERMTFNARTRLSAPAQEVEWRALATNLHSLDYAEVRMGQPARNGGAIVEVGNNIVLVSQLGRFSYLTADYRFGPIELAAPIGLEGLRASGLLDDPLFSIAFFRVFDLYARETGPGQWDLYASFARYAGENCFQFVVARTPIAAGPEGVRALTSQWSEVFVARPGCLRMKDTSWRYVGAAGGRMVELDERTLLISVGDHQFDGFNDSWAAPQDPETDLGKIIALDVPSGQARIYATGVRNPQGLVVMRDGRVFESEHGPQGGDEINVLREGANYGWPIVTYGVNYGYPRRDWPANPNQGGHHGYVQPAMAFAPSIAPSALVEPDPEEFPLWRGDLLLATLKARTLFHVRTEGERLIYAEPIEFGPHDRLRDMISLSDGRVLILSENGTLIFLRNAEAHGGEPRTFVVTGMSELGALAPEEAPRGDLPPVARGRAVFGAACMSCHSLNGEIGAGPPLNGVMGRRVGGAPGYGYSPALAEYDGVWNEALMRSYLTDPERHFAGTTMPPAPISWMDAPDVIAYLKTTRNGGE